MNLEKIENKRRSIILQFAVPSIIAMVLTSMINIVDGYFMGNYVGTEGLAAVNLGLPIVYLYLATGLMISVGGISMAGRMLGAKEVKKANEVFRQTMVLCIVVTCVLTLLLCFLLEPMCGLFQADALTRQYFNTYYGIMIFELPMMVLISSLGMFIRGEGNPVFVMLTNVVAVVLNGIFDYVFVGPLDMGAAGIAWASVLSAGMVLIINILYFFCGAKVFRFGGFHFDAGRLLETILNGGSEFIGELSMCLSMAAYNYIVLKTAGVDGVAAFTIIGYVSYVFSMIIVGFGQGIVPIVSFSYGAEKKSLSRKVRNTTIKMVVAVAIGIFAVMLFLAGSYSRLFSSSSSVIKMVTLGLKLQMSSFAFSGINTIVSFYFTAIGKAKESAVISASRGLVVLMIAIFILPTIFGITGVWLVSLTTEAVTLLFSVWYMKKNKREESRDA